MVAHAPKYPKEAIISPKLPDNLRKKMELFQAKSSLPVFLKGGPADKALFGLTVVLCGVGLLGIAKMGYDLGFKKRNA